MTARARSFAERLATLDAERARLRARFAEKMKTTPSLSDREPMGEGPANAHGMPRIPPGQNVVLDLPVLDLGDRPDIPVDRWRLEIDGAVEEPFAIDYADLLALPQVEEEADFHCVTGFSVLGVRWRGVPLDAVVALARPCDSAMHLMAHGYDGYSTNLPLEEALKGDVVVAHALGGEPLAREHGGPVRVVAPQLYAWKGAKWLSRLELLDRDRRGYWEIRGYSNRGWPWRDDRMW